MGRQNISITVDAAIFYENGKNLMLLLVQRKNEPYKGIWALPGSFLEDMEPMVDGAKRELEEETGLKIDELQQIRAFGDPGRDPRGRTISIAFTGKTTSLSEVKGNDDAADAK